MYCFGTQSPRDIYCSVGTVFKGNTSIVKFNELALFSSLSLGSQCFQGCTALQEVTVPPSMTTFPQNGPFYNCSGLKKIHFPAGFISLPYFGMCCSGSGVILLLPDTFTTFASTCLGSNSNAGTYIMVLQATTPPSTATNVTNKITAMYVPDSAVDTYKTNSGWSSIAAKIHPLSDYDGSIVSPVWQLATLD